MVAISEMLVGVLVNRKGNGCVGGEDVRPECDLADEVGRIRVVG